MKNLKDVVLGWILFLIDLYAYNFVPHIYKFILDSGNSNEAYRGVADARRQVSLIVLTILFKGTFSGFGRVTAAPTTR